MKQLKEAFPVIGSRGLLVLGASLVMRSNTMKKTAAGKNILAIISARGGSKRLPGKNIKTLVNKPLLLFSIEAAKKSRYINRIIVSTDDAKISSLAKSYGVEVLNRPQSLATDYASSESVLEHVLHQLQKREHFKPDIVVLLQPTSPLRTVVQIDKAIELFEDKKADMVVSVKQMKEKSNWIFEVSRDGRLSKLDLKKDTTLVSLNGAIYVYRPEVIIKKRFFLGTVYGFVMDKISSIDIDDEEDFKMAETLLKNGYAKNKQ